MQLRYQDEFIPGKEISENCWSRLLQLSCFYIDRAYHESTVQLLGSIPSKEKHNVEISVSCEIYTEQ